MNRYTVVCAAFLFFSSWASQKTSTPKFKYNDSVDVSFQIADFSSQGTVQQIFSFLNKTPNIIKALTNALSNQQKLKRILKNHNMTKRLQEIADKNDPNALHIYLVEVGQHKKGFYHETDLKRMEAVNNT